MRLFLSMAMAAIFVASAVCAPIYTEAIAAPTVHYDIAHAVLPAPAPTTEALSVRTAFKNFDGRDFVSSPMKKIDAMTPSPHMLC